MIEQFNPQLRMFWSRWLRAVRHRRPRSDAWSGIGTILGVFMARSTLTHLPANPILSVSTLLPLGRFGEGEEGMKPLSGFALTEPRLLQGTLGDRRRRFVVRTN